MQDSGPAPIQITTAQFLSVVVPLLLGAFGGGAWMIARMDKVIDAQSALEREMIEAHSALRMQLEVNDRRVSEQLNATRESSRQEADTLQGALRDLDTNINDLSACVADISEDVDNSTVCRRIGNRSRQ